jgi:hypothetical protein
VTHPEAYRETQSEYVHEFAWPPLEAFNQSVQHANADNSSKQLENTLKYTLNTSGSGNGKNNNGNTMKGATTEYREQFFDVSPFVESQPVAHARRDHNPPQFAWPLMDGEQHQEPHRGTNNNKPASSPRRKELSEHTAEFNWPVGVQPAEPMSPTKRQGLNKSAPVYAVDNEHFTELGWHTEYEDRFNQLRRKQRELMSSAPATAGVATMRNNNLPINFAWEESKKPTTTFSPRPAADQTFHALSPDHFHTEYQDNFLQFQVEQQSAEELAKLKTKQTEDHLNFSEEEKKKNRIQQLRTEYQENFKRVNLDLTPSVPTAASSANPYKKPERESMPPQFAWPLIDRPPTPSPEPVNKPKVAFEQTEAKSAFLWPPTPPPVEVRKPHDHNPPMGTDADLSETAHWQSEYDTRAEEVKKQQKKTIMEVPAGIVTVNVDQVPSFFAWADQEAAKKASKIHVKTFHYPKNMDSELHDAFKPHPGAAAAEKYHEHDTLNLFDPASLMAEEAGGACNSRKKSFETEYDANFKKFPLMAGDQPSPTAVAGIQDQLEKHPEYSRPPQFAWNLLSSDNNNEANVPPPVPPSIPRIPFKGATEYDSKFAWRPESYLRTPREKDEFKSTFAVIGEQKQQNNNADKKNAPSSSASSTQGWQTEYGDRCEDLVNRQNRKMAGLPCEEENAPIAGVRTTPYDKQVPPFYAWTALNNNNKKNVVVSPNDKEEMNKVYYSQMNHGAKTESTEYADKFHPLDLSNATQSAATIREIKYHNTKDHIFALAAENRNKFHESTEYRDQFQPNNTVNSLDSTIPMHNNAIMQHHQQVKYGSSLKNTILDRFAHDPLEYTKTIQSKKGKNDASPTRLRGKPSTPLSTEYSSHFNHWPEKGDYPTTSLEQQHYHVPTPGGHGATHHINDRSSAQYSVNPVNSALKQTSSPAADDQVKNFLQKSSSLPLTETQERFNWPDAAVIPSSSSQDKERKMPSKKKLVIPSTLKSKHFSESLQTGTGKLPWGFAPGRAKNTNQAAIAPPSPSPQGTPQRRELPQRSSSASIGDRQKHYHLMNNNNNNRNNDNNYYRPSSPFNHSEDGFPMDRDSLNPTPGSSVRFHPHQTLSLTRPEDDNVRYVMNNDNESNVSGRGGNRSATSATSGVLTQDSMNLVPSTASVGSPGSSSTAMSSPRASSRDDTPSVSSAGTGNNNNQDDMKR